MMHMLNELVWISTFVPNCCKTYLKIIHILWCAVIHLSIPSMLKILLTWILVTHASVVLTILNLVLVSYNNIPGVFVVLFPLWSYLEHTICNPCILWTPIVSSGDGYGLSLSKCPLEWSYSSILHSSIPTIVSKTLGPRIVYLAMVRIGTYSCGNIPPTLWFEFLPIGST